MNIEPGKFYKTRGGNKVRIYATDGFGEHPVHGAILYEHGWQRETWTSDGVMWVGSASQSDHDIIAEWTDKPEVDWSAIPRWANWVAMSASKVWTWFSDVPEQWSLGWSKVYGHCGQVPDTFAPKNFTGDWKDSLIERPKEMAIKVTSKNLPNQLVIQSGKLVLKADGSLARFSNIPDGTEVNLVPHSELKRLMDEVTLYKNMGH